MFNIFNLESYTNYLISHIICEYENDMERI